MFTLCATTLLGLLAAQAGGGSVPAETTRPALSPIASAQAAPDATVPLAPVPHETSCAYFDEGEWRARLLDPDLAAREAAYSELLELGRRHAAIRSTIDAWARDKSGLELAWTARLAMRELNRELQQAITSAPRVHIQLYDSRPWQQDYQRQLLMSMGYDPDEYRISGAVRLSPQDIARIESSLSNDGRIDPTESARVAHGDVLGVVCDESLDDRVLLTRVVPGSIADAVGLAVGDRLLRIGDHMLGRPSDIGDAMDDWNTRGHDATEVLEIRAVDGRTGEEKVRVWAPPPGR